MKALPFCFGLLLAIAAQAQVGGTNDSITISLPIIIADASGTKIGYDDYVRFTLDIVHRADGVLTGTATADYGDEFASLFAAGSLRGRVSGSEFVKRMNVAFTAPITGTDDEDHSFAGMYSLNIAANWGRTNGLFNGAARTRFAVNGIDNSSATRFVQMDAECCEVTLTLNDLSQNGAFISGTAQLTNAGRTFDYLLRGQQNFRTGQYGLRLTGTGTGQGSMLTVRATEDFTPLTITGRLLGQVVKYRAF